MAKSLIGLPEQKPDIEAGYHDWLRRQGTPIDARTRTHYETIGDKVKNEVGNCELWKLIQKNLKDFDDEYYIGKKFRLISDFAPTIYVKSFDSFFQKTYRKNILHNTNFPDPPPSGWLLPPDWYSKVNDIVRTTIVVKYLDGVQFLTEKICELGKTLEIPVVPELEARTEGYYAAHLYYSKKISIPDMSFSVELRDFTFEIQISTQIKEIIKTLLHKLYEKDRLTSPDEKRDWRWDYRSEEFVTKNLGHILHYVEGMIVQVRDQNPSADKAL